MAQGDHCCHDPSSVTVTLMDFGKVISVHRGMWSIRRMRRDLCQIPSRIRRLYAPSVVPVSGRMWSVDDEAFARNFTLGKNCTLTSVRDASLSLENRLDFFLTMFFYLKKCNGGKPLWGLMTTQIWLFFLTLPFTVGMLFESDGFRSRGPWKAADTHRHINELELLAAYFSLQAFTNSSDSN